MYILKIEKEKFYDRVSDEIVKKKLKEICGYGCTEIEKGAELSHLQKDSISARASKGKNKQTENQKYSDCNDNTGNGCKRGICGAVEHKRIADAVLPGVRAETE